VRVGSRADLILVDGDPLANVARLATPAGVMKRGRWLPRAELQMMLEQIAAKQVEQTPPAR
jgi:imidazolonepropionase-like amidohydrolase